jgi:hypothetical protein
MEATIKRKGKSYMEASDRLIKYADKEGGKGGYPTLKLI